VILALLLAAAQPQVVAVLEFRDKVPPGQRIDAAYLSDQVRSAVKETVPQLKVITRENMLVLLQASGKDLASCEGECEVDTGRRIGADLVISGELLRFGTQYKLNMKLHDTRSGELLSGAVASGAGADDLDRNLRAAAEKLLAPLLQGQLSEQRAQPPPPEEKAASLVAFGAHAVAGYGVATLSSSIGVVPVVTTERDGSLMLGGGLDLGLHLGPVFSVAAFGEIDGLPGAHTALLFGGGLVRALLTRSVSLDAGVGFGRISDGVSGIGLRGDLDYRLSGPWGAHLQFIFVQQSTGNGLFAGSDSAWAAGAGVSLLY
jgi:hypothetical protein